MITLRTRNFLIFAALLCGIAFGSWLTLPPMDIDKYAQGAPQSWAKLEQTKELLSSKRVRYHFVPLNSIAWDLAYAAIVGEDGGYLDHGPWDLAAIREAFNDWWQNDDEQLRGASTLTQQLAKNLYLSSDRSWWRKLREARYAYWLEERLGKRRILELYLNVIELAPGVFGVDAGAQYYFGVHAVSLNAEQAAELAAAIPSPLRHNPATRTAAWRGRLNAIRERMQSYGFIRERLVTNFAPRRERRASDASAKPKPVPANAATDAATNATETPSTEPIANDQAGANDNLGNTEKTNAQSSTDNSHGKDQVHANREEVVASQSGDEDKKDAASKVDVEGEGEVDTKSAKDINNAVAP